jgi:hypothetical protein
MNQPHRYDLLQLADPFLLSEEGHRVILWNVLQNLCIFRLNENVMENSIYASPYVFIIKITSWIWCIFCTGGLRQERYRECNFGLYLSDMFEVASSAGVVYRRRDYHKW